MLQWTTVKLVLAQQVSKNIIAKAFHITICSGIKCTHLAITCHKFEDSFCYKWNLNAFILRHLGELMVYDFTSSCKTLKLFYWNVKLSLINMKEN